MRLFFEERLINIEEGINNYYLCGNLHSTTCMIFLNGLYHGKEAWTKQQRNHLLYDNFKMVFVDYRGAGKSVYNGNDFTFQNLVDDIRKIVEAEKPENVIMVGYSIGGLIALYYTYLYKKEVAGLILLNTGISLNIHATSILEGLVVFLNNGIPMKEILRFIIPWNHSRQYLEKINDFEENVRENYENYNKNISSFKNFLKAVKYRPNMSSIAKEVTVPTLLIGSNNDYIFPVDFQIELHSILPNSVLNIIDNCGHASFIEKDAEVNAIIKNFLTEIHLIENSHDFEVQSQI